MNWYHDINEWSTWSSANLRSAAMGSPPGDRMKMSGAQQWLSLKDLPRSNGGGSINFLASLAVTKSWIAGITCQREKKDGMASHSNIYTTHNERTDDTIFTLLKGKTWEYVYCHKK